MGGSAGGSAVPAGGPAVIELAGAARTYPGPPPVHALRPTDLTVHRAEYIAVVGPSGSGKSTLLNVVGLVDRPTGGHYRLDGIDTGGLLEADRTALRGHRIGLVFQAFHLLPYRTATENVMLAQVYLATPRARRRTEAVDALLTVGLGHRLDALPSAMSGGERQRVAIARALVNRPSLLLCDEPTGNLDTASAGRVMDTLDALNASGITLVVITHDPAVAARARRTLTIRDGELAQDSGQFSGRDPAQGGGRRSGRADAGSPA
ncbi:ABC transporter ATP-binding protein [Streptomyces sp. NPDC050485]|uniref:ABC transporter ATP-binding protein n=1 Tax=Streptomyces sp. NPDC050485 TaxID=3365617 RepID=UPI0037BC2491